MLSQVFRWLEKGCIFTLIAAVSFMVLGANGPKALAAQMELEIYLDNYGFSGWNGAELLISINGGPAQSFHNDSASSSLHTLTVNSGDQLTLTWRKGANDQSCYFNLSYYATFQEVNLPKNVIDLQDLSSFADGEEIGVYTVNYLVTYDPTDGEGDAFLEFRDPNEAYQLTLANFYRSNYYIQGWSTLPASPLVYSYDTIIPVGFAEDLSLFAFWDKSWSHPDNMDDAWLDPDDSRYASYGDVSPGSAKDFPWRIQTAAELAYLNTYSNTDSLAGQFIALSPPNKVIDLSAHNWMPVNLWGRGNDQTFNESDVVYIYGENTKITGLKISDYVFSKDNLPYLADPYWDNSGGDTVQRATGRVAGLFGSVWKARIGNLELENPIIYASSNVWPGDDAQIDVGGGLVGTAGNSMIVYNKINNPQIHLKQGQYSTLVGGAVGYTYDNSTIGSVSVEGGEISISPRGNVVYFDNSQSYLGGLVGSNYQGAILNGYSNTLVNLNVDNNYDHAMVGGLVGYSSAKTPILSTCIFNSYSRSNINITAPYTQIYVGGIAGYLEDEAINTYYIGNFNIAPMAENRTCYDPKLSQEVPCQDQIGQLFGNVYDSNQEYNIDLNYYQPLQGQNPIGLINKADWEDKTTRINQITNATKLLRDLEQGRAEVVRAMLAHTPSYPESLAESRVEHWIIKPGVNDGYPIFGQTAPTITLDNPQENYYLDFANPSQQQVIFQGVAADPDPEQQLTVTVQIYANNDPQSGTVIYRETFPTTFQTPISDGVFNFTLDYNTLINYGETFTNIEFIVNDGQLQTSTFYTGTLELRSLMATIDELVASLELRLAGQIYYPQSVLDNYMINLGDTYDGYTLVGTIDSKHQLWSKNLLVHPDVIATDSAHPRPTNQDYPFLVRYFVEPSQLGELKLSP